jgi:hypothetical protein
MPEPENGGAGARNALREICQLLYEVSVGTTLVLTISDSPKQRQNLENARLIIDRLGALRIF